MQVCKLSFPYVHWIFTHSTNRRDRSRDSTINMFEVVIGWPRLNTIATWWPKRTHFRKPNSRFIRSSIEFLRHATTTHCIDCVGIYIVSLKLNIFFVLLTDSDSPSSQNSSKESKGKLKDGEKNREVENEDKPLLNKTSVLCMLGELVKSYSGVAQLIDEFEVQHSMTQSRSQVSSYAHMIVNFSTRYLI